MGPETNAGAIDFRERRSTMWGVLPPSFRAAHMRGLLVAALLSGCGVTGNDYVGHPAEDATIAGVDATHDATHDALPTPCAAGTWFVRFIPSACPICIRAGLCTPYATPPFYTVDVGETLQLLNCEARFVAAAGGKCVYETACTPSYGFERGGSPVVEEFFLGGGDGGPGRIVFEKFYGPIVVVNVNGQTLSEYFDGVEIGLASLTIGLCGMTVLFTKVGDR